ncbi:unnamed protein product [Porites lobata]|uniref:Uncharacterized protein n=1 Tax=Porites lobata TaxID=104759 RepID=A0ABN8PZ70_9CNID|nr:unnamed protein product [Porites lobata]
MDIVSKAVQSLNPGQVPIITADQPLYTIAKQIQWNWPGTHGEDKFVVMLGGLHIEMAALMAIGNLLDGSGWGSALVQAGVATPGTADSFCRVTHVTRTRRAHQITAGSLFVLLEKAYSQYLVSLSDYQNPLSLEEWCSHSAELYPQFKFWLLILQMQLALYVDALTQIVPWFFALDQIHYARWIPVHLRDMVTLKDVHPTVFAEFMKGNFVVKKTERRFSAIAIDQAHEQNNASVKDDGGAVGLTENPAALRRWMVSGPEMARVIEEFEASTEKRKCLDFRHHEEAKHVQKKFTQNVKDLAKAIEEMGNPFTENSNDLLVLDSRDLADPAIIDSVRNGNLDEFFKHENQAYPPALSQNGKLRTGTKSDLVSCLEELVNSRENATHPIVEVIILDGSVLVNMLRPGSAKTFSDYASQVFLPYVASQLQQASRVDIVWDEYRPDSLKAETRVKRGKGVRRRVKASTPIPAHWQEVPCIETEKQVLSTIQSDVVCTQSKNVSRLTPCTHEEADTRIILHLEDAVTEGFNKISIRTVDTDVVVLAVAAAQRHRNTEIWIAFGTGKSFRFLAAHEMARILGPDRCIALPMFHAFTGCDTVSFFGGRGKRTAWDTWRSYNDITLIFVSLANTPESVESSVTSLERFVILLYDRTSSLEDINQARKHLFAQKGRSIENIPPTKAALVQHIKRAVYQAGYCWAQATTSSPDLPCPSEWGWKRKEPCS